MSLTPDHARDALADIRQTIQRTRKAVEANQTSTILMLWGAVWIACYTIQQFSAPWAGWAWLIGNLLGILGTICVGFDVRRKSPATSDAARRLTARVFLVWPALFLYIPLWLYLLAPWSMRQSSAFIASAVMFLYVVIGLWLHSTFLLVLGLTVTALILLGFVFLPSYFFLWMAFTGGGALFGSGLYIRLAWR
jgi:hypothetical protein